MMEIYPHAAFVALWDLPRAVKYKRGPVAEINAGLREVRAKIRALQHFEYPLIEDDLLTARLGVDPGIFRSVRRKEYEDALDAVFGAYIGYLHLRTCGEATGVFGDVVIGYVSNPRIRPLA